MRSRKDRTITPHAEALEAREVMTAALPLHTPALPALNMDTYHFVVKDVNHVAATTAYENHNLAAVERQLANIASMIPYGKQQLVPLWLSDLNIYSPGVPASGLAARRQMLLDLNNDIIYGIAAGEFQVDNSGYQAFYTAVKALPRVANPPGVSAQSVTIANNSAYDIAVTATVPGTAATITQAIPNQGSALFDFDSPSHAPIAISVVATGPSQINAGTIPHPLPSVLLYQPFSGYGGRTVTITQSDNFFVVNE